MLIGFSAMFDAIGDGVIGAGSERLSAPKAVARNASMKRHQYSL
jgi:hypothetical protein